MSSLQQQGLPSQWFDAVDGRHVQPSLLPGENLNIQKALVRHQQALTNSELGCYLSHYRAIKQAYDAGYNYVCIIEDDVVVEPQFGDVVRALMQENLDLVRLMALKLRRRKVVKELLAGTILTRPERGTLGTQAYLFSRNGMKKFIHHAGDIYEAIDHVLDHFFLYDLDLYAIEPHAAYELVRESSIQKKPSSNSLKPNLWQKILHPWAKLRFSMQRHAFMKAKKEQLYPNELPKQLPGKSARLRGKGEAADIINR